MLCVPFFTSRASVPLSSKGLHDLGNMYAKLIGAVAPMMGSMGGGRLKLQVSDLVVAAVVIDVMNVETLRNRSMMVSPHGPMHVRAANLVIGLKIPRRLSVIFPAHERLNDVL